MQEDIAMALGEELIAYVDIRERMITSKGTWFRKHNRYKSSWSLRETASEYFGSLHFEVHMFKQLMGFR